MQGQYKQIDINVVNKHDDNVLNIPTDQLAIYKVQPRSWIFSNQEQVQWVAGWRAWTPNYKTSALIYTSYPTCMEALWFILFDMLFIMA